MSLLGAILVLPYMVVFFSFWLAASLARPVSYATIMLLILNPFAAKRKLSLFVVTFRYMFLCNDKKWKEPDAPKYSTVHKTESKTVIFVRHGESTWNETFNKGDRSKMTFYLQFLPNVIKDRESWFYDSPLSDKGKAQAEGVRQFLKTDIKYSTPREARLIRLMLGDPPDADDKGNSTQTQPGEESSSQLISSNLRRAISTLAIGVRDRLDRKLGGDSILILSQMQEISRNPDALCITPPGGRCELTFTDPKFLEPIFDNKVDTSMHSGNKPINTNGLKRLQAFCKVLFEEIKKENVVCAGHSLWFRSFFRTYLPKDFEHISKVKKIQNGGCVGFTLEKKTTDNGIFYEIVPSSITVLYIGFQ